MLIVESVDEYQVVDVYISAKRRMDNSVPLGGLSAGRASSSTGIIQIS